MVTDSDRAKAFLAVDRYGEDTPETRDMLKQSRADRVQALEAAFAAVRAERDAEWSAAARKAHRALDLQLNNRYGSYMMTSQGEEEFRNTATESRDALNALIEEVK